MNERRDYKNNGHGRRDYDRALEEFCKSCNMHQEVKGVKKILVIGVSLIITVFVAVGGWFAHIQEKNQDYLLAITKEVAEISVTQKYRVLPALNDSKGDNEKPNHKKMPSRW